MFCVAFFLLFYNINLSEVQIYEHILSKKKKKQGKYDCQYI